MRPCPAGTGAWPAIAANVRCLLVQADSPENGDPGWILFELAARKTMRFAETVGEVSDPWKKERLAMVLE